MTRKHITINNSNKDKFLNILRNNEISIIEDISGTKLYISFDENNDVQLRYNDIDNYPINMNDISYKKLYSNVYNYFTYLDPRIKILCQNLVFGIITNKADIYLVEIFKDDFIYDILMLQEYSELFGIKTYKVFYNSILDNEMMERINYFLNTKDTDKELIFGTTDFSYFLSDMLEIDKRDDLIISVNKEKLSFEVKDIDAEYNDFSMSYSIIIAEMLEYLYRNDYENIFITGDNEDTLFFNLISELFTKFIDNNSRILNFDFDVPPYIYMDSYKLNRDIIPSKLKDKMDLDPKIEFMFKTCLKMFRKPLVKIFGIIDENLLKILNNEIMNLQGVIDKKLRFERTVNSNLRDISKKYTTSDGKVFLDTTTTIEDIKDNIKK